MKETKTECQFPVGEMHPCGPWACGRSATKERGTWHFCKRHAKEYDNENKELLNERD